MEITLSCVDHNGHLKFENFASVIELNGSISSECGTSFIWICQV